LNTVVTSFAPIADKNAQVLILGSMPGVQSLNAGQYYAHKQNAFWRIMADIVGFSTLLSYEERTEILIENHIAMWDVLHSCERAGSLDSAIAAAVVNDFHAFYKQHPNIRHVYFNGATAERYYSLYVLPQLTDTNISYLRLPSTSPAHASLPYQEKLSIWQAAIQQSISSSAR
jgi:hypoxanthine-DNA glycosylase